MKNLFRKIGSCTLLLFVVSVGVTAEEWRGIVPLQSTRDDVKRLFGTQQSSEWAAYYNLRSEIVVFHFQTGPCTDDKFGLGWNVPPGTVVTIGVIPKRRHRKEQYSLPGDARVVGSGSGFVYYANDDAGLTVETFKDVVTMVEYSPKASQDNLRCPRIQECCIDFFPKFDEYEELPFNDEKARLDNFAIHMMERFGRGTIEVLGPSKKVRQKRMKIAERAKKYLVNQLRVQPQRILLVDGGFSARVRTRLSLYSIGGLVSRIYLFPEKDP